jgi:hypothetical protein
MATPKTPVGDESEKIRHILALMEGLTPVMKKKAMRQLNQVADAGWRPTSLSFGGAGGHYSEDIKEEVEDDSAEAAAPANSTVIVEAHTSMRRLRNFSGKKPTPSGEVDFGTWRLAALQIIDDRSVKEKEKKRMIQYSLLRPALDVVRELADASSKTVFDVLDAAFGVCVDGAELFVKFLSTYQNEKEDPSGYLQRLYINLLEVVDYGGLAKADMAGTLLKQFVRGCREEELLMRLRVEDLDPPPSFSELLLLVRKEEARRTDKKSRLKTSTVVKTASLGAQAPNTMEIQLKALQEQVAGLTNQL